MSESAGVAITTVFFILIIVDIVGNSLVCTIIKRNRDMRIPINYLLVNLAVADIMFATFIAPKVVFNLNLSHPEGVTGTVLCKLLTGGNVAWIGGISSVVTLTAIAIERYYAVMYPLGNKGKLTKRKLKVIIPGSWIFSLIFNTPLFLVRTFDKNSSFCVQVWTEKWMAKAYSMAWLILTVLSCAVMVVLYSRIVYALWFKHNDDNQLTYQQQGVLRVRKRVTMMVIAVSAIFGICWGAESIEYVLRHFTSYKMSPVPAAISDAMALLNSAVNPFVFALLNQQFREKINGMICCKASMRVHPTREPRNMEFTNNNSTTSTNINC